MGWTVKAKTSRSHRHSQTCNQAKQTDYSRNCDRQGNVRRNHWATTWTTGSTRWAKRITNRQQRRADDIKVAIGIEDYFYGLEQTYLDLLDWYDDEPMDYEYPEEPEPVPEYDPYYYDDYYGNDDLYY